MNNDMEKQFRTAISNQKLDDFGANITTTEENARSKYNNKDDRMNTSILNNLEMLYFPEKFRFRVIIVESEVENMNDGDDMILENDDDNWTTLNERVNIDKDECMSDTEGLDQTTNEDIILTHILGQKSNGVITIQIYSSSR